MISIIEGVHNEKLLEYVNNFIKEVNCRVICGDKKWTYYNWMNALSDIGVNENVIIVDSWLASRIQDRFDGKEPHITEEETKVLNFYIGTKGGHVDFIIGENEDKSVVAIMEYRQCGEEDAKKVMASTNYEIMNTQMYMPIRVIKNE